MSQPVSLESMLQNQGDLHRRISKAYENLKKMGSMNYTLGVVESRVQALELNWKKFESQHEYMQLHFREKLASSVYVTEGVFEAAEEAYLMCKGRFLDILANLKPPTPLEASVDQGPHEARAAVALPRIHLPQFSGKYSDWVPFRDIFSSLIRRDSSLTNVEKLHYLKTCVKGEAEELLSTINITSENFSLAWETLSNRFENKRLIVKTHLHSLISMPIMLRESQEEIKRVLHVMYGAVGGLETIGRPISSTTDLLVHLIVERLDGRTRRDWEDSVSALTEPPSYDELKSFLEKRLRTLEALHPSEPKSSSSSNSRRTPCSAKSHLIQKSKTQKDRCPLCSRDHFLLFCEEYKRMLPIARNEAISRFRLCVNCLGRHSITECKSMRTCMKCAGRHHTTIHDVFSVPTSEPAGATKSSHVSQGNSDFSGTVLLATALVNVMDQSGERQPVRALIDPGSEVSLVSEALVHRLRLRRQPATVSILGVGSSSSGTTRGQVLLDMQSRTDATTVLKVKALILPRITAYSADCTAETDRWPHLRGLALADPYYYQRTPIDVLLGADIYAVILKDGVCKGELHQPMAQLTSLGWILSGTVSPGGTSTATSLQCSIDSQLHRLVERFWEHEEFPKSSTTWSAEEQNCEEHFARTHFRLPCGRYVVRLPVKDDLPPLAETRGAAARLLRAMENRFAKDSDFSTRYHQFMTEYQQLDHMSVAPLRTESRLCYLPHHGVVGSATCTPKFRVVFNGSQRLPTGESLNDYLLTGPKLLPDLSDVILQWRRHKFVFAADIEKMYRQIRIHSADQDLQRILWRSRNTEDVQEFNLKTVTYGLACAPFLAIRTLRQLATDEEKKYPLAARVLRENVYVDDMLAGASTLEDTLHLQRQLIDLCSAGGFPLRKWVANDHRLLAHLPLASTAADFNMSWDDGLIHSTLGLRWHLKNDCFSFSWERAAPPEPLTKRSVLSTIARTFDPLGWLAPVTIHARIFFQSLWLQRLEWDTPLHPRDERSWRVYSEGLPRLGQLRVPRFVGDDACVTELHGFADASERAYAAVLYLRCVDVAGRVTTSLLMAKTRVAPIKQISLPRLELSAAVLLARLSAHAQTLMSSSRLQIHLWTDSMVVLGWIRAHPSRWKTYIANRVSEIQRLLPDAFWHHVSSKDNPADCASRGLMPGDLDAHPLWWHGSPCLSSSSEPWKASRVIVHPDTLPEQRTSAHLSVRHEGTTWDLERRFSSLDALLRVTAWCQRWIARIRRSLSSTREQVSSSSGAPLLTTMELQEARMFWVRHIQNAHFTPELEALSRKATISQHSPLRRLNPFVDGVGLLRVGGRLKHSLLSYDERHPLILPSKSTFVHLLITNCHARTMHGGVQQTLGLLRRKFWILQGRLAVRSCIRRCVTCARWRAATIQPMMGDLPQNRITPSRPFTTTGLDYAGPISLRMSKGRGNKSYKGYLAIFVCFSTRAVHLELVSDYSTDAFLAAFRRFTSRRGMCRILHSDCGTNFIGADAQLRKLFAASSGVESIRHRLLKEELEWRFNPPSAPHFGGLWEAAVKSVKFHLRRVIGDALLTFEEMYTVLTQIEACLNSRPLQALTDDPEDLSPLTPAHFLIGSDLLTLPEPSLDNVSTSRLGRWQLLQQMRDHFWRRWSDEYLHTLQARVKWWRKDSNLRIGDLCLVKNELYPPSRWPLARIVKLHTGTDGQTRVVTVRTRNNELKRPATKIVLLPGCSESSENP